jgi:hypothetical protein
MFQINNLDCKKREKEKKGGRVGCRASLQVYVLNKLTEPVS